MEVAMCSEALRNRAFLGDRAPCFFWGRLCMESLICSESTTNCWRAIVQPLYFNDNACELSVLFLFRYFYIPGKVTDA
jgi:hypothetical protein